MVAKLGSSISRTLIGLEGSKVTHLLSPNTKHRVTHSMELSPWEAHLFSASQEIPCILWYPKLHYRVHYSRPQRVQITN